MCRREGQRKYWTRRELAEWLVGELKRGEPAIIGIDHAFSFPLQYFEAYQLERDWDAFLDDFQRHWPTDEENVYVDFVREGLVGQGAARAGNSRWRRVSETLARAKSVFHFDVPGSVAKSTHAGLPWLRYIRSRLRDRLHFWPFDGWLVAPGRSAVVEIYPALWSARFDREDRSADQHDAFSASAWLAEADRSNALDGWLTPRLSPAAVSAARAEGWILGVGPIGGTVNVPGGRS